MASIDLSRRSQRQKQSASRLVNRSSIPSRSMQQSVQQPVQQVQSVYEPPTPLQQVIHPQPIAPIQSINPGYTENSVTTTTTVTRVVHEEPHPAPPAAAPPSTTVEKRIQSGLHRYMEEGIEEIGRHSRMIAEKQNPDGGGGAQQPSSGGNGGNMVLREEYENEHGNSTQRINTVTGIGDEEEKPESVSYFKRANLVRPSEWQEMIRQATVISPGEMSERPADSIGARYGPSRLELEASTPSLDEIYRHMAMDTGPKRRRVNNVIQRDAMGNPLYTVEDLKQSRQIHMPTASRV